jgi:hypothetical protein
MKKILFVVLFILTSLIGYSQHYEHINVVDLLFDPTSSTNRDFCTEDENLLGVIIVGTDCPDQNWMINPLPYIIETTDSLIIMNPHETCNILIGIVACEGFVDLAINIRFYSVPENPFIEPIVWKRQDKSTTLSAPSSPHPIWSTNETTSEITVNETGIYSVTLSNICDTATYSVEVRDNVEIYRATCDLKTNKNDVTWQTTPEQSEYITAVKVYRNNELVGTVPYADGSFTDNIGSENTQWQYHIVGVSVEGADCPIPSYWKRTIHLDRIQDSQGNLILQWTPYEEETPAKDEVTAYGIYDVVNGVPNHVIDVGNFTNVYTYNPADFHGYGAVAAVFAEKGLEDLAFSNLTKQMLDVDENLMENSVIKVYPNPSNGTFIVECVSDLIVYNAIGQVVATSHASENGVHNLSLGTGIYFVKSGEGTVRKVVIE